MTFRPLSRPGILFSSSIFALLLCALTLSHCSSGPDPLLEAYQTNCVSCHGKELEGTPLGPALLGQPLLHGEIADSLIRGITNGYPTKGMPAFGQLLSETEIRSIAIMILEQRKGYNMADFKYSSTLTLPTTPIESERHRFRIESVATGLDPWPYSIAPLPDGRILLVEKTRGLSIISPAGEQSALIQNTPKVYDDAYFSGVLNGSGWMLDVALHPDYESNGWIYLSYSDRCRDCNEISRQEQQDVSMCALIRGRIREGKWVDQETIWKADIESYVPSVSAAIGGRICFDQQGHVFLSVGGMLWRPIPASNIEPYLGIQNLSLPYGKVFRFREEGGIPADNPFVGVVDALPGIWTYGHRSPQGLEVDTASGQLWETEMGPRGGDEVNLLQAGNNYGWPLTSKGVNYDGTRVDYGPYEQITGDTSQLHGPMVDLTPSPAVSSFAFYRGAAFPQWDGNLLVGSLKATELYRMVREGDQIVHQETLLSNLARIRDIEIGPDGYPYLLLEHTSGSQVVRLVPEEPRTEHPELNPPAKPNIGFWDQAQHLVGDFNGDGLVDTVRTIIHNGKKGIQFRHGGTTDWPIIGAGIRFGNGGDDFEWVDIWHLVDDSLTYQQTFSETGEVLGTEAVVLPHLSLYLGQEEAGGAVIAWLDGQYRWIHQAD